MGLKSLVMTLAAVAVYTGTAGAIPYVEVPDAGQTMATAQDTVGIGALTAIEGKLALPGDADMYRIWVNGGAFSATTYGSALPDPVLHLYSPFGFRLLFNDDSYVPNSGPSLQSGFSSVLPAGEYCLAISEYPNGYACNNASTWMEMSYEGGTDYTINLTGASFATTVPEPATLVLLCVGLAGVVRAKARARA